MRAFVQATAELPGRKLDPDTLLTLAPEYDLAEVPEMCTTLASDPEADPGLTFFALGYSHIGKLCWDLRPKISAADTYLLALGFNKQSSAELASLLQKQQFKTIESGLNQLQIMGSECDIPAVRTALYDSGQDRSQGPQLLDNAYRDLLLRTEIERVFTDEVFARTAMMVTSNIRISTLQALLPLSSDLDVFADVEIKTLQLLNAECVARLWENIIQVNTGAALTMVKDEMTKLLGGQMRNDYLSAIAALPGMVQLEEET